MGPLPPARGLLSLLPFLPPGSLDLLSFPHQAPGGGWQAWPFAAEDRRLRAPGVWPSVGTRGPVPGSPWPHPQCCSSVTAAPMPPASSGAGTFAGAPPPRCPGRFHACSALPRLVRPCDPGVPVSPPSVAPCGPWNRLLPPPPRICSRSLDLPTSCRRRRLSCSIVSSRSVPMAVGVGTWTGLSPPPAAVWVCQSHVGRSGARIPASGSLEGVLRSW